MTDLKQEARTLTLGERMVLAARIAVLEHLRQSVTVVPSDESYFAQTEFREEPDCREEPAEAAAIVVSLNAQTDRLAGAT
jgi:hypothetical protein